VAGRLEAMRARDSVRLLIVGEGTQRAGLEAMIPWSLRGRVAFTGFQPDVPRYLAAIDIFVSPTEDAGEGFGLRVAEAMMAGIPVIATKFGGHPEVVTDGLTGVLISPGDRPALTRSILRFVTEVDERLAMGRRAHQDAVRRFGTEAFADGHETFLTECWRRSGGRS
jgi:glycosyltransferase involved in cell wall biosynthesis